MQVQFSASPLVKLDEIIQTLSGFKSDYPTILDAYYVAMPPFFNVAWEYHCYKSQGDGGGGGEELCWEVQANLNLYTTAKAISSNGGPHQGENWE